MLMSFENRIEIDEKKQLVIDIFGLSLSSLESDVKVGFHHSSFVLASMSAIYCIIIITVNCHLRNYCTLLCRDIA